MLPIVALVKEPSEVIPGADVPSMISTPLALILAPVSKSILTFVVQAFVAACHKNSLFPSLKQQ